MKSTINIIEGMFFDERGELRRERDYKYKPSKKGELHIPSEFQKTYQKCKAALEGGLGVFRSQLSLFTNKQISLHTMDRMMFVPLPNSRNLLEQTRPELGIWGGANWLRQIIVTRNSMFVNLDLGMQLQVTRANFKTDIAKECIQDYFDKLIKDQDLAYKCSQLQLIADINGWGYMFFNPWTKEFDVCTPWHVGVTWPEFLADDYRNAVIIKAQFPLTQIGRYLLPDEIPEGSPLFDKLKNIHDNDSCRLELLFSNFERKKVVIVDGQCYSITDYVLNKVPLTRLTCGYPIEGHINSVVDELSPLQNDYNVCAKKKSNQLKLYGGSILVASGAIEPELRSLNADEMKYLLLGTDRDPGDLLRTIDPTPLDAELRAELNAIKADMFEVGGLAQIDGDLDRYRQIGAIIAIQQIHESSFQYMFTILASFLQKTVDMFILTKATETPDAKLIDAGERYPVVWRDVRDLMENINVTFIPVHKNTADGSVNEDKAGVNEHKLVRNSCWRYITTVIQTRELPAKTPYWLERTMLKHLLVTRMISGYQSDDEPEVLDVMGRLLRMLFNEELEQGLLTPYFEAAELQRAGQYNSVGGAMPDADIETNELEGDEVL